MTKKMRKAHSAVSLPIEGEGSKASSKVFPHRSHVMTSVAESPATGKNISKPSRPMVVVAKRAAPLNPVQQSQYKKLRFVPPEYQAELRNWVKDSSPMYRTPLRGTIAPLQQQSGTFNTSSAIGRTPPVDMMHRESAYSKAQSAQGATKMARKKKMEEGAEYAPSGASAEEILFSSLGGAPMKKRSIKRPIPPKMPPPFPPGGVGRVPRPTKTPEGTFGGGSGTMPPRPNAPTAKPTMGMGKMSKARFSGVQGFKVGEYKQHRQYLDNINRMNEKANPRPTKLPKYPEGTFGGGSGPIMQPKPTPPKPKYNARPVKNQNGQVIGTSRGGMGMGKMSKANRLPGGDRRYNVGGWPVGTDLSTGRPRVPGKMDGDGKRPIPYKPMPGKDKISNPPYKPGKPDMSIMPVKPGRGPIRINLPKNPNPVVDEKRPGGRGPIMGINPPKITGTPPMRKSAGQGAFINGNLAPQSHALTKSESCPDCGGKMTKGMCKNMCKGMMHKANTRAKVQPGSEGQMRQDWNAYVRVGGAKNKDTTRGKAMSKGAGMCKCGSGMSKSMCKCGM